MVQNFWLVVYMYNFNLFCTLVIGFHILYNCMFRVGWEGCSYLYARYACACLKKSKVTNKIKKWKIPKNQNSKMFYKAQFASMHFTVLVSFECIFSKKGTAFFPYLIVGFQRSSTIHWSNEFWMIYLEKRRGNSKQITRWIVRPNELFSPGPVFAVYLICWASVMAKNWSQIITLQQLVLRCCSQWTEKGDKTFNNLVVISHTVTSNSYH